MNKKLISFGIISMFLLTCLIVLPVGGVETNSIKTIYVDDSGRADYTRIQDGIDNANSGDIIYVYSGIYFENLIINKTITLIGENKESVIISGDYENSAIKITGNSEYVNISGFTIKNGFRGIHIDGKGKHNISGNKIISNKDKGVRIKSDNNTLINNHIMSNKDGFGPQIDICSSNNLIKNNDISSDSYDVDGIHIDGDNNLVEENEVFKNCDAIVIFFNGENTIKKNQIFDNIRAIGILESNNNLIVKNNFIKCKNKIAYFQECQNTWNNNYWNRPRLLSKPILGYKNIGLFIRIPFYLDFDMNPALIPH
jgi:parallel beta-helix repeat protein